MNRRAGALLDGINLRRNFLVLCRSFPNDSNLPSRPLMFTWRMRVADHPRFIPALKSRICQSAWH